MFGPICVSRRFKFVVLVGALALFQSGSPSLAETYSVQSLADGVNGQCATGTCTLRDAVIAANDNLGVPDTILLMDGTHTLNLIGPGEDAALTGDLDLLDPRGVVIEGQGIDQTVIQADDSSGSLRDRVFDVIEGPLTLRNLTLRGGTAGSGENGGAIWFRTNGNLIVENCRILDNSAVGSGGAIAFEGPGGSVTLRDSTLSGNRATSSTEDVFGGGVLLRNTGAGKAVLTIEGSVLSQNQVSAAIDEAFGGAICVLSDMDGLVETRMTGSIVRDCTAGHGGGGLYTRAATSTIEIASSCSFVRNAISAPLFFLSEGGGAICVNAPGVQLSIDDTTFQENTTLYTAATLSAWSDADDVEITVMSSLFERNVAALADEGSFAGSCLYVSSELVGASATFTDCQFRDNTADGGGCLVTWCENMVLEVDGCLFEDNSSGTGACLDLRGGDQEEGDLNASYLVTNCQFLRNKASTPFTTSGRGGAISVDGDGDSLTIEDSLFVANRAEGSTGTWTGLGGAINIDGDQFTDTATTVDIDRCVFEENVATASGGAIHVGKGAGGAYTLMTVQDTTFRDNIAGASFEGSGGGVCFKPGALNTPDHILTLRRCTFDGNQAELDGGGLFVRPVNNSEIIVRMSNCTFGQNLANRNGGGLCFEHHVFGNNDQFAARVIPQINHSTFTQNIADFGNDDVGEGGGMYLDLDGANLAPLSLANTIVGGNIRSIPGASIDIHSVSAGDILSFGYNLISRSDGAQFVPSVGDIVGTKASPEDPGFEGVLAHYGGWTDTQALATDSQAVDAANPGPVGGIFPSSPLSDQRGKTRPLDGDGGLSISDIGAFEVDPDGDPTSTPTPTFTETATPTSTASETPDVTETPTATNTDVPVATNTPTEVPEATDTPTDTPVPTDTPTGVPVPTDTPTEVPVPSDTPTGVPEATATATPDEAIPTATATSTIGDATPTTTPTPTEEMGNATPTPINCDLVEGADPAPNPRCDVYDLLAILRDRRGIEEHDADFNDDASEDALDLFLFGVHWYHAP